MPMMPMAASSGSVTKNGVLRYATTVNGGKSDITMYALYGNDNWQITDRLRIDAGIRHEKYAFRGYGLLGDRSTWATAPRWRTTRPAISRARSSTTPMTCRSPIGRSAATST